MHNLLASSYVYLVASNYYIKYHTPLHLWLCCFTLFLLPCLSLSYKRAVLTMDQRLTSHHYLKLLSGWIIQVWVADCLSFSFSKAGLLPNSFIANLLSEAWNMEEIWFLKLFSSDAPLLLQGWFMSPNKLEIVC